MVSMQKVYLGGLIAALLSASAALAASASDTIALRKGNFKEIGGAFKTVNDEIRSGSPDMNSLRPAAQDLASRAKLTANHFPKGSGPEAGVPTRALPSIWKNSAAFSAERSRFIKAAGDLNDAVKARDTKAMEAARRALGASCKGCHDKFRKED